ncbi:MAG TPA: hypothetical protein VMW52_07520 [Phycisphaerae bacterium]|nr:hypothetical protein [Phycisphaerae bacterium]
MRMALSLETLKDFDCGKASVAFSKELERLVRDLLDRPGEKAVRTLILQCELKPIVQQDGDVVDAEVVFIVRSKIPPRRTAPRPVTTDRRGNLIFNDMAADNPHQTTIDEA